MSGSENVLVNNQDPFMGNGYCSDDSSEDLHSIFTGPVIHSPNYVENREKIGPERPVLSNNQPHLQVPQQLDGGIDDQNVAARKFRENPPYKLQNTDGVPTPASVNGTANNACNTQQSLPSTNSASSSLPYSLQHFPPRTATTANSSLQAPEPGIASSSAGDTALQIPSATNACGNNSDVQQHLWHNYASGQSHNVSDEQFDLNQWVDSLFTSNGLPANNSSLVHNKDASGQSHNQQTSPSIDNSVNGIDQSPDLNQWVDSLPTSNGSQANIGSQDQKVNSYVTFKNSTDHQQPLLLNTDASASSHSQDPLPAKEICFSSTATSSSLRMPLQQAAINLMGQVTTPVQYYITLPIDSNSQIAPIQSKFGVPLQDANASSASGNPVVGFPLVGIVVEESDVTENVNSLGIDESCNTRDREVHNNSNIISTNLQTHLENPEEAIAEESKICAGSSKGEKTPLWQRTEPFTDPVKEKGRLNAIKARKNRVKKKEDDEQTNQALKTAQETIKTLTTERTQKDTMITQKDAIIRNLVKERDSYKKNMHLLFNMCVNAGLVIMKTVPGSLQVVRK